MYQDQRHALIVAAGLAAAYLGDDETVLKTIIGMVQEGDPGEGSEAHVEHPQSFGLANLRVDLKSALRLADDTAFSDVDLVKAVAHQYEALASFRLSVPHVEGLKAERAIRKLRDSGFVYSDLHGWTTPPPPVPTASASKTSMAAKSPNTMSDAPPSWGGPSSGLP